MCTIRIRGGRFIIGRQDNGAASLRLWADHVSTVPSLAREGRGPSFATLEVKADLVSSSKQVRVLRSRRDECCEVYHNEGEVMLFP